VNIEDEKKEKKFLFDVKARTTVHWNLSPPSSR
jgi:hypothetical protein